MITKLISIRKTLQLLITKRELLVVIVTILETTVLLIITMMISTQNYTLIRRTKILYVLIKSVLIRTEISIIWNKGIFLLTFNVVTV